MQCTGSNHPCTEIQRWRCKGGSGSRESGSVEKGIVNLEKHIEESSEIWCACSGYPELFYHRQCGGDAYVREFCETRGCEFALSEVWEKGGEVEVRSG